MLRTLLVIVAVVFGGAYWFTAYALAARFVLHGPVHERSLEKSVDEVAGFGLLLHAGACEPAETGWSCATYDDSGGGATYHVVLRPGSSCWDGRLQQSFSYEVDPPRELSGCVRLWQWRLL